jgi:hypothetical protein
MGSSHHSSKRGVLPFSHLALSRCSRRAAGPSQPRRRAFERIADAVASLPVRSVVLDGEAVAHCHQGLPAFHRLLSRNGGRDACLYVSDVLMIEGEDLRRLPLDEPVGGLPSCYRMPRTAYTFPRRSTARGRPCLSTPAGLA